MRRIIVGVIVAPSLILALGVAPAQGQVRVGVHIDIPIIGGHAPVVVHRPAPPPRYVVVYQYSSRDYGRWNKESRKWRPATLYLYEGRYYEEPYRNARAIRVWYYRDRYFFEPRERDWYDYRDRYFDRDWRYDDRFDHRPEHRYDDRYDRDWNTRRDDDRNERARPEERSRVEDQGRPDDRDDRARPDERSRGDDRSARPGQSQGRGGPPPRPAPAQGRGRGN